MTFFTGEKIKIFPNTNVSAYMRAIKEEGFEVEREDDYIIVGTKLKHLQEVDVLPSTIRYARKRKGLTRKQLADMCEVTKQTVMNWEYGYTTPRELDRVKEILGFE